MEGQPRLGLRDCAMITRSGAGPKQGGVIQLFIEPEGGSYDFYFGLRGGQTTLFCCILHVLNAFVFVFHAYIIHRFLLSSYGPTIYSRTLYGTTMVCSFCTSVRTSPVIVALSLPPITSDFTSLHTRTPGFR